jgi:hypothetical protein
MPSSFKISTNISNSYVASATRSSIKHSVPDTNALLTNPWSVSAELTGTAVNTFATTGGGITINASTQVDPISRANIVVARIQGFIVSVGRANPSVAPSGTVPTLTTNKFAKLTTTTAIPIAEGSVLAIHTPTTAVIDNTETLVITMTGSAGYRISVMAYGAST